MKFANGFVNVIGAGLAGSEAALQLADRGISVRLFEMKPNQKSAAHRLDTCAELVCSNSLKSIHFSNASGLLKEELAQLNCRLLKIAYENRVPAGKALAVDREQFSLAVTHELTTHPRIELIHQEIVEIPEDELTLIATGPLTSPALSESLSQLVGNQKLYFFDSVSPIVDAESIDRKFTFTASRYSEDEGDYINCPMDRETYGRFVQELVNAEKCAVHEFDRKMLFEGCLPVEEIAGRGPDTLAFGPLRPVGFDQIPRPHAVVQLRKENTLGTMYNLVGFQTRLAFEEQKRVFRMIPGLANAQFLRLGKMHRNLFLNSPQVLNDNFSLKTSPHVFIAGQLVGGEGYVESMMTGLFAALNIYAVLNDEPLVSPSNETMMGGLIQYLLTAHPKHFQPMNANFGLLAPPANKVSKKERPSYYQSRSSEVLKSWKSNYSKFF